MMIAFMLNLKPFKGIILAQISPRKHTTHNAAAQMNNHTQADKHIIAHIRLQLKSRVYALHCLNIYVFTKTNFD
jgi:hypothetical protein